MRRASSAIEPPYSSARSRTMARPKPGARAPLRRRARRAAAPPRASTARRPGPVVVHGDRRRPRRPDGRQRDDARATAPTCRRCRAGCRASRRDLRAGSGPRAPGETSTSIVSPRSACRRSSVRASAVGRRRRPSSARRRVAPRRGGARVREVVVDLPPHPLDLLARSPPRARAGPRRRRARPRARAPPAASSARARDRRPWRARRLTALLAVLEQRVEIVDERLHLARVAPFERGVACPRARRRAARAARSSGARPRAHDRAARASIAIGATTISVVRMRVDDDQRSE